MTDFQFKNNSLFCGSLDLSEAVKIYGTPLYIYSMEMIRKQCLVFMKAFENYPTQICYAVKANSRLAILKEIAKLGFGSDIVSHGELLRVIRAGFSPDKIVFSGVGKTYEEIELALKTEILTFNVESAHELQLIDKIAAKLKINAPVSIRINPNIDARTNPYIATGLHSTKFGISEDEALELFKNLKAYKNISLMGIACHIGSQITDLGPIKEAAVRMREIALDLVSEKNVDILGRHPEDRVSIEEVEIIEMDINDDTSIE